MVFKLGLVALVLVVSAQLQAQRLFFTGGGCSTIPGIGAPALMVFHAHKYLVDTLNNQNPYTSINFVYQESAPSPWVTEITLTSYSFR